MSILFYNREVNFRDSNPHVDLRGKIGEAAGRRNQAKSRRPDAKIDCVLVQQACDGIKVIMGVATDPQFR